jgi:hypothetical protein
MSFVLLSESTISTIAAKKNVGVTHVRGGRFCSAEYTSNWRSRETVDTAVGAVRQRKRSECRHLGPGFAYGGVVHAKWRSRTTFGGSQAAGS